jgi:hypothetical protein
MNKENKEFIYKCLLFQGDGLDAFFGLIIWVVVICSVAFSICSVIWR